MRRRLDLPHRLHQSILHCDRDIAARVSLGHLSQRFEICGFQITGCVADGHFKHFHPAGLIWETYVDSALKPPSYCGVQLPGDVRSS